MRKYFVIQIFIVLLTCSFAYAQEQVTIGQIEAYIKAVVEQEGGDQADFHFGMGFTLLEHQKKTEAMAHFKKAVDLNPELYEAWYEMGRLNVGTEAGNNYFRKSIEINPGYGPPHFWLGYSLSKEERYDEAAPFLEKYLQVVVSGVYPDADWIPMATKLLEDIRSGVNKETLKMAVEIDPSDENLISDIDAQYDLSDEGCSDAMIESKPLKPNNFYYMQGYNECKEDFLGEGEIYE